MQWYYSKNNTQFGPVAEGELRAKLSSGEISPTDLVWKEGMVDWLPAFPLPEFAGSPAVAPPPVPIIGSAGSSPHTVSMVTTHPSPLMAGTPIPNYLWQAILVMLFCCQPFGIVAVVYAAKVDGLRAAGDVAGALTASASARTWCWVSFALGLVTLLPVLIWFLFVFVFGAVSVLNHH